MNRLIRLIWLAVLLSYDSRVISVLIHNIPPQTNSSYSKVVRVGLLAKNREKLHHQGFLVRKGNLMDMVHSKVYANTLFEVSTYECGELGDDNLQGVVCGGIDVFIHTLKICDSLLTQCSKMAHVLDLQDNKRVGLERLPAMDGEVFMSRAASSAYCVTRFCLPLTFTFNLDWCRKYIDKVRHARSTFAQSTKYRLVGLVGNAREYGTIAEALHQARIPFIREARGKGNVHHTCVFYSQITLAVAWSPYIPTKASLRGEYRSLMVNRSGHFNQSSVDYWYKQKPPERFTNLQWFDIPTIGYDQYASYQAYGADFLCGSNSCVVDLIARIERGELDATVERVRQRVKADTSVEGNGAVLRAFLSDVYEFRQNQLSLQR